MATKLTEYPDHWVVEQVTSPGKRKRMPRVPVVVVKGDQNGLRLALIQAAALARHDAGVQQTEEGPVA